MSEHGNDRENENPAMTGYFHVIPTLDAAMFA